ncbi:MAG: helix-turn-helix transcriptional regulator [Bacilli bacterium]|nr:helix-turn-helix transcriptional regulator [Bacilli bacterium]
MNQQKIGNFIAVCRKQRNMTQEQLAEKLNVSNKTISRWETGRCLPDPSLYELLCTNLEVSLTELFEGRKLNIQEQTKISEKNLITIITTRRQLENIQLLTEILICIGIIITISLTALLAVTPTQKIITLLIGWFVWIYGLFLRIKIKRMINKIK